MTLASLFGMAHLDNFANWFPWRYLNITDLAASSWIVLYMSALSVMSEATVATRRVCRLVALGDSTVVGLGDPLPGGRWRGFAPLLAEAAGVDVDSSFLNLSFAGARMSAVRTWQLPDAVASRPDVAVVIAGMNDTLRSDFDPMQVRDDFAAIVDQLSATGCLVLTVRYHDHAQLFRLPAPLRRALRQRINALNAVIDQVVAGHDVVCLDLEDMPGVYDPAAWSVDRLHPSEYGHRCLALAFSAVLEGAGRAVPAAVSLECSGGVPSTRGRRAWWITSQGVPWLWRRGRDFVPYAAAIMAKDLWERLSDLAARGEPSPETFAETFATE